MRFSPVRDAVMRVSMTKLSQVAYNRMSKQRFLIANSKQGMRYASVAYIYLGRLDQPLPDISVPGRQPANDQEIDKKVEITGDRLAIDS